MLSSASRKLRFWKKRPDKKKEVTTEVDALLNEIEQRRGLVDSLKRECARLRELKSDLEQFKTRFEALERRTTQQGKHVEKRQAQLQASLKMAEDEIERLTLELETTKKTPCESCDVKDKEQKKYLAEINCLQETVLRLEKENNILQSLVREYTLLASRAKTQNNFTPNLLSQTSVKSDPEVIQARPDPLGHDLVRRSSLSLNDFLDGSTDDVQSEKFEAEKNSGCSSPERKGSASTSDFWEDHSNKQTSLDEPQNTEDEGFRPPTLEGLIEKSRTMGRADACTSDVFSSATSGSSKDLASRSDTPARDSKLRPPVAAVADVQDRVERLERPSRSLKNLSRFSRQETALSMKHSASCPSVLSEFLSCQDPPLPTSARTKKRRSLDDPKTLAMIYLSNKVCQTDLQRAVDFFRAMESCEGCSRSDENKRVVITKDKVAALREYFERKNAPSRKLASSSSFKISQKSKPRSDSKVESQESKSFSLPVEEQFKSSETPKRLCSIPRLNGFRRISKATSSKPLCTPHSSSSSGSPAQKQVPPPVEPQQSRDVRSASVPSPVMPNKYKESPQFKIAFMKSTSLRSFNHLALNRPTRTETKHLPVQSSDAEKSKKTCFLQKQKILVKSTIIENLDKYKLNRRPNCIPTKNSPVLVVDVTEDTSDNNLSNDEASTPTWKNDAAKAPKENIVVKRSRQIPPVTSCQCRTKASRDSNPVSHKPAQIRSNGLVSPPNVPARKLPGDKRKAREAGTDGCRLVQRDDPETNQTFFCCEAPTRKTNSSIPVRTPQRSSHRSTALAESPGDISSTLAKDQAAEYRPPTKVPSPHPMGRDYFPPKTDGLPRPLTKTPQESMGKTPSHPRLGGTRKSHPHRNRRPPLTTPDKHWPQCAKTNPNRNAVSNTRGTDPFRCDDGETRPPQNSVPRDKNKNVGRDLDEFREISKQLDRLTMTESNR